MNPPNPELLADKWPVCRQGMLDVTHKAVLIKRIGHAVGGNPIEVDMSVSGIEQIQRFACNLRRARTYSDGRWRPWEYGDQQCRNAQQVMLSLRGDDNG